MKLQNSINQYTCKMHDFLSLTPKNVFQIIPFFLKFELKERLNIPQVQALNLGFQNLFP